MWRAIAIVGLLAGCTTNPYQNGLEGLVGGGALGCGTGAIVGAVASGPLFPIGAAAGCVAGSVAGGVAGATVAVVETPPLAPPLIPPSPYLAPPAY